MAVQHLWLKPSGRFGPGGNKLIYPLIVQASDVRTAIPYILGWAAMGGEAGTIAGRKIFRRSLAGAADSSPLQGALPITDPDGYGMFATDIPNFDYWAFSGRIAMETYPDGTTPSGVIYNNQFLDRFSGGDQTDVVGGGLTDASPLVLYNRKVIKRYKYVRMAVQFEHVPYQILTDAFAATLPGGVSTPELSRFTWSEYIPSMEYVSMDRNILQWVEGPDSGKPMARGAGFPRSTGEVKVNWYGLPAEAISNLITLMRDSNIPDPGSLSPVINYPGIGCVNDGDFTIPIYNNPQKFTNETLMWVPGRTTWKPSPLGELNYNVEINFLHRPEGWNKFFYYKTRNYFRAALPNGIALFPKMPFPAIFELG
jgi:hypothetical protein